MIAIGCDHAGCEMKKAIIDSLSEKGFDFKDMGCNGERCDYPVVRKVFSSAEQVSECQLPQIKSREYVLHCAATASQQNTLVFITTRM